MFDIFGKYKSYIIPLGYLSDFAKERNLYTVDKRITDLPKTIENENIKEYSYTWKEEYALPYESKWGRIAKFCYLNGLSWSYVLKTSEIRKKICQDPSHEFYLETPRFTPGKIIRSTLMSKFEAYRFCPKCMKYGYHSYLHEIAGIDYCFLHGCALIDIPSDKFEASKNGTYEFVDVKTEDIINNEDILNLINQYIHQRMTEGPTANSYIFFNPQSYSSITDGCYESTRLLYEKHFFLIEDTVLKKSKCISKTNKKDVDKRNKILFNDKVITNTGGNKIEKRDLPACLSDKKFAEIVSYYKNLFIRENTHSRHFFGEDVLGACFIKVISDAIRKAFRNFEDWDYTQAYLNNYGVNQPEEIKTPYRLAIVLAYQAITNSYLRDNTVTMDSRHWCSVRYLLQSYGLPVYEEFGYFHQRSEFQEGSIAKEAYYIVYPIINDLFWELVNQATYIFENKIIDLDKNSITELSSKIWKPPQYVVMYYKDRVEIYRCDPE